jgi:OOP family OmpA-OmpF porin
MKNSFSYMMAPLLAMVGFIQVATGATDVSGSADHPLLKRVTGSYIMWFKRAKFDELTAALARVEFDYDKQVMKSTKREKHEGALTTAYYKLPQDTSTLEAVRQYEGELKPKGFEVLWTAANDEIDDGYGRFVETIYPVIKKTEGVNMLHQFNNEERRYSILKGEGKAGNTVYVALYAFVINDDSGTGFERLQADHQLKKGDTIVRVDVLETQAMEARMTVVKAEEIEQSMKKTGRVAIYGVYFDTDKAVVKSESAPSLIEMAKAIKAAKGKVLIVGHTDNQGGVEYNQALSQRRAAAVLKVLAAEHAVPSDKMLSVGVGLAAPVAPNTDEEGRAKNRRVEMVAL